MKLSISTSDVQITHNYNDTDRQKLCSGTVVSAALTYFDVLSLCDGVVLQINKNQQGKWTVIVQYDRDRLCKYNDLVEVNAQYGSAIKAGSVIGKAYQSMKFEYLTSTPNYKFNPIRFGMLTYYIADPTDIITGKSRLVETLSEYTIITEDSDIIPMPESEIPEEFQLPDPGGDTDEYIPIS